MKYEKSCGIVVYRSEKCQPMFLLLKYPEGHWGFPKGHKETGESEKETSLREIGEETGIKNLKFIPRFKYKIRYEYKTSGVKRKKTVIFFMAETQDKKVKLSDEHVDYKWVALEDAMELITFVDERELLGEAYEQLQCHEKYLDEFF